MAKKQIQIKSTQSKQTTEGSKMTEETAAQEVTEGQTTTESVIAVDETVIPEVVETPATEQTTTEEQPIAEVALEIATQQPAEITSTEITSSTIVEVISDVSEVTDAVSTVVAADPSQDIIEATKLNGSVSGKSVILALEAYIAKMKPGIPVESKEGARHQEFLWRTLCQLIDSDTEDFQDVFRAVLALVHREGKAAFAETHLFRFTDNVALGQAETKAFLAILDLIKITADPKGRQLALKQVDFHRSMEHHWSERARQRVATFYNL